MESIGVIGAGTMGNGIAQTFALFGFSVQLIDLNNSILDKGAQEIEKNLDRMIKKSTISANDKIRCLQNLNFQNNFEDGITSSDLVVEAATEKLETKIELFKSADILCPPHTILASNTSSISITHLASVTKRPEKVIGMHFMNPVPVMKLVELVMGLKTSEETFQKTLNWALTLQKVPIRVNDYPGFISNRILLPMINEAIFTFYEGVAGVEEIDSIMTLGMSHPMGPLQLADFIGLDVCLSILEVLYSGFKNPKYAPCPLLVNMVRAGYRGIKSGEGFYVYDATNKSKKVNEKILLKP